MIKNILVADDSMLAREALKSSLTANGLNIITASSGDEARKMIPENNLDLLILDNQMRPGPTGLELCAQYSNELPVIMVSSDMIEQEAYAAGAKAFFPRPIQPEKILAMINELA